MDVPFVGRTRAVSGKKTKGRRRGTPRPPAEVLEARLVLSQFFTVTNTSDNTGAGSLRWAIGQVNADTTDTAASPDQIQFNIPTTDPGYNGSLGVWTISPTSSLPAVSRPVVIDGYTQPGASPNTLSRGDNAVIAIRLDGTGAGNSSVGLTIDGDDSAVRGLALTRFSEGIELDGSGRDVVAGDFIGIDPSGMFAAGNTSYGIDLVGSAANTIGGTAPADRDVISGNDEGVFAVSSSGNLIQGNYVGTDRSGTVAVGNTDQGLSLGALFAGYPLEANDTIGGTTPGAGNLVSGNSGTGINLGVGGDNLVQGNFVGLDATGESVLKNLSGGVEVDGPANTIGGTTPGAGNVLAGNVGDQILLRGAAGSLVEGNLIGTDPTGTKVPSGASIFGGDGIAILGTGSTIGGTSPGAGNVISGNGTDGIDITQSAAVEVIQGNRIGTDITGTQPLGNGFEGIDVGYNVGPVPGGNILIGGSPAAANTIAYSGGNGVSLDVYPGYTPATGVSILSNSIHDNSRLGIDLGNDGVTPNTPGGPHPGPNNLQNFPVLTAVTSSAGSTAVTGTLNSAPNAPFTIQFFASPKANPSGYGEGQTYLGQLTVTTDAEGNASFQFVVPVDVAGQFLSATATSAGGDTSEFAKDLAVPGAPTAVALAAAPNPVVVGQPVTFTATVAPAAAQGAPTGTVTFFIDGIGHAAPVVPSAGGLTGTATYTTTFPTAGAHGVVALYSGDASFAPSVSISLVQTVTPPIGPPPRVVEILRYGYHALPTQLVVEFNEPLDIASAQDPANYAIAGPGGRPIAVVSASLMPGGTAVLLRPQGRLNVHDIYTLTVAGGVESATGVPIGSDQVTLVTLRNLTWRQAPPAARAVDAALASGVLAWREAVAARVRRR